jgi:hypothetical protein
VTLLTSDGRLDRAAILRDARRQFLTMQRHGWGWRQCVRYSWTRAKAEKERDGTARAMEVMKETIITNLPHAIRCYEDSDGQQ